MTEFETACRAHVGQLRKAFIELYDSIGADPGSPQDVARKLRVNKTLAWNVARLLQGADGQIFCILDCHILTVSFLQIGRCTFRA